MKKIKLILGIIIVLFLYKIVSPFVVIDSRVTSISKEKWIKDVEYLGINMPKKHKNLFFNLEEVQYKNLIEKLKNDIPNLSESAIKIRILEIVAKVGDSHTYVKNYKTSSQYPIYFYWFKEGIFITEADEEYKDLLGCKVTKINGIDIEEITKLVSTLVPHENSYWLKYKVVDYMNNPEILKYFNIAKDDVAKVSLETLDGKTIEANVSHKEKKDIIKTITLESIIAKKPFYLRSKETFWTNFIDEKDTLYMLINSCGPVRGKGIDSIVDETLNNIDNEKVHKIVIDLRNNVGGIYIGPDGFVATLSKMKNINEKDKLFVITGRKTFSSALNYSLALKEYTNATFYGEPTGGKPSSYGEVRNFTLPNSKLNISYSTKYFESKLEGDTLLPDYIIEPSIKDYITGVDPVMEEILKK